MSRTDHARRPRVHGHVTSVRHVRHYNGQTYYQSVCSCGLSGSHAVYWHVANEDSRDHHRAVYERVRATLTEKVWSR